MVKKKFFQKAFFLDRDGVINKSLIKNNKPLAPRNLKEFKIIKGVKESLIKLKKKGFVNIIITNQPDARKQSLNKKEIYQMHEIILKELSVDDIFVCFHNDKDNCLCRKPKPGLVYLAVKKWKINLKKSFLIGDRWRDIELASFLGMKSFFIDYGYQEKIPKNYNYKVKSLKDAINIIYENNESEI